MVKKMIRVKQIEIGIKSLNEFLDDAARDMKLISERKFKGKKEGLYFESINAANRFLTPKRIALLKAIKKYNPDSLYELAKITKRPLKSINRDIAVLKEDGLVEVRHLKAGRKRTMPIVDYDKISIGIEI
jgi:predicted transcriptional regulator